jgi:hypothetical protein
MVDYYTVLARAAAGLPDNNAQARRELYDRARMIVLTQLRRRDPQERTPETIEEQSALEEAIRRVEAESRPVRPLTAGRPASGAPASGRTTKPAKGEPPPNPGKYLAKILQALQSGAADDHATRKPVSTKKGATATAGGARPQKTRIPDITLQHETGELGIMLKSLGTMMLVLAYSVAAIAFTGVVYIRTAVLASAGIIGYPIVFVATALVLALFVVPPWAFFRKTSTLPSIGFLRRALHAASHPASRQTS